MRATGIVRRIDDLGRVVIPKEIRRTLGIREGDALEIFTNRDGEVIFKKYCTEGLVARDISEIIDLTHDDNAETEAVFRMVRAKMEEAREILSIHEKAQKEMGRL